MVILVSRLFEKREAARSLCEFSPFSFFGRKIVLFKRECRDFDKVYRVNSLHVVSECARDFKDPNENYLVNLHFMIYSYLVTSN